MPSSVIAAMHYDDATRSLSIVYRGKRGTYRYFDVSPEEYEEFRASPSKGTYLNQVFKSRQHPYQRVGTSRIIHPTDREPAWQEQLQKSLSKASKTTE
ncbi:MAG TPA: KTSC domain-containing protein [Edaphobacter sp.]|jgi:hypothetical protein|nr:KTSC domain-containing protein [Edaphobacter sp.]